MNQRLPRVSVLMSVYNDATHVGEAIDSIIGQSFSDYEFLIVDDASTDASFDVIRSFPDPRIRIFQNASNIGLARSLNKGLENARGDIIARIDSDDISLRDRLKVQVEYMDAHPRIGMVGCQDMRIDENGAELDFRKRLTSHSELSQALLWGTNPFRHSAALFRTECVRLVGLYRERPRQVGLHRKALHMAQDYDLWLRISEVAEVANIDELLCKYRVHAGSMTYGRQVQQAADADWAHRLAIQRQIYGQDELGFKPPTEPFSSLRNSLAAGFLSRKRTLSDRYFVCGRDYPFRHGKWSRGLAATYFLRSLYNNPLNGKTWRYLWHKATGRTLRQRRVQAVRPSQRA